MKTIACIAFVALFATPAAAVIRYVNATVGANSAPCTAPLAACQTVTFAMNQAVSGDEIQVAPGTYNTALGEVFPIVVKSGVYLKSTAGAATTILDASGANQRVVELLNANSSTIVEGFTITGGAPAATSALTIGGGMTINGGAPTIRKNLFLNNQARGLLATAGTGGEGRGGGMHVTAATPTIVNNVFRGNQARGGTGGFGIFFGPGGPGNGRYVPIPGLDGPRLPGTDPRTKVPGCRFIAAACVAKPRVIRG